jgi:hypothetical protein
MFGVGVAGNGLRSVDRSAGLSAEWILALGLLLVGGFILAAAIGLLRKRPWGVVMAAIVALPLAPKFPHGTVVAVYTAFVAMQTLRERRAAVTTEPTATKEV